MVRPNQDSAVAQPLPLPLKSALDDPQQRSLGRCPITPGAKTFQVQLLKAPDIQIT